MDRLPNELFLPIRDDVLSKECIRLEDIDLLQAHNSERGTMSVRAHTTPPSYFALHGKFVMSTMSECYACSQLSAAARGPGWDEVVKAWSRCSRAANQVVLYIDGLEYPHIYGMARIAWLFAECKHIVRVDQASGGRVFDSADRASALATVRNKPGLPHILVHFREAAREGYDNQRESETAKAEMLALPNKLADIGLSSRAEVASGRVISRQTFDKKIYEWITFSDSYDNDMADKDATFVAGTRFGRNINSPQYKIGYESRYMREMIRSGR